MIDKTIGSCREAVADIFDGARITRADTTLEVLARLKPLFGPEGTVTAVTPQASTTVRRR